MIAELLYKVDKEKEIKQIKKNLVNIDRDVLKQICLIVNTTEVFEVCNSSYTLKRVENNYNSYKNINIFVSDDRNIVIASIIDYRNQETNKFEYPIEYMDMSIEKLKMERSKRIDIQTTLLDKYIEDNPNDYQDFLDRSEQNRKKL